MISLTRIVTTSLTKHATSSLTPNAATYKVTTLVSMYKEENYDILTLFPSFKTPVGQIIQT